MALEAFTIFPLINNDTVSFVQMLSFQMLVGCLLAAIIYFGILRCQGAEPCTGSTQGFLIGYGIVIPLSLWLPFIMVDWLDIRNVGIRLGFCSLPMTVTLRCLEAMYGFVPSNDSSSQQQSSLWNYAVSVGFILRPMLDKKTGQMIPLNRKLFMETLQRHLFWMGAFGLAFHATRPSGFYPFPTAVVAHKTVIYFELGHLYNTFVQAGTYNIVQTFSSFSRMSTTYFFFLTNYNNSVCTYINSNDELDSSL